MLIFTLTVPYNTQSNIKRICRFEPVGSEFGTFIQLNYSAGACRYSMLDFCAIISFTLNDTLNNDMILNYAKLVQISYRGIHHNLN